MTTSSKPPVQARPIFLILAVIGCAAVILAYSLPSRVRGGKAKLPRIVFNLRLIDNAKQMWASDHAATNGTEVSKEDLMPYLGAPGSTQWIASIDSEVYRVNAIGTAPETQLESAYGGGSLPKGTRLRWTQNMACEKLLPNPQGGANGWQPLSSNTSRTSTAAAPRRSP